MRKNCYLNSRKSLGVWPTDIQDLKNYNSTSIIPTKIVHKARKISKEINYSPNINF